MVRHRYELLKRRARQHRPALTETVSETAAAVAALNVASSQSTATATGLATLETTNPWSWRTLEPPLPLHCPCLARRCT
jgi:hypothetical protein